MALTITLVAAGVAGVAAGLAREAWGLEPHAAGTLLFALFGFLVFECLAHFLGARARREWRATLDRSACAALSSAGIWIALLVLVPLALGGLGMAPSGIPGLIVMTAAAAAGLYGRIWFLREIYEIKIDRAATLWVATRGAALLVVTVALAVYAVANAVGGTPSTFV